MKATIRDWLSPVHNWLRQFWDNLLQMLLAYGATVILYTGLLYCASLLWVLYVETPVGQRFIADNIVFVGVIENLLRHNFFVLTLRVTIVIFTVCVVLGAVIRTLLVMRYLYDAQGFFGRLIFWGIPCAVLTSFAIHRTLRLGWAVSFSLGLLPTLVLFDYCFRFTLGLVPEIPTVFGSIVSLTKKGLQRLTTVEPETNGSTEPIREVDLSSARYGPEKRGEPRYKGGVTITYYDPEGSPIDESIGYEISNHGFCLWRPKGVATDDIIKFELRLENARISGEAQIKWISDLPASDSKKTLLSKAGCRILSMTKEYENILRSYLNKQFSKKSKK